MRSQQIIDILTDQGIRGLTGYGEVLKGFCPFHSGSSGKTLWVGVDSGRWGCWSTRCVHHKSSDLIKLFRALGHSERSAATLVARLGTFDSNPDQYSRPQVPHTLKGKDHRGVLSEGHVRGWRIQWEESLLEYGDSPPHVFIQSRNVSPRAMDQLEVGYDGDLGAFVFNLRLADGSLCGITRRTPLPGRPYIVSGSPYAVGHPMYRLTHVPKGKVLWGLWEQRAEIQRGVPVVVVEGFFDVLRLRSKGVCAVAKMGSRLTKSQTELLLKLKNPLVLWPDRDAEGLRGVSFDVSRLLCADVRCVLPKSSDPGDTDDTGIERSLQGAVPPAEWLQRLPTLHCEL